MAEIMKDACARTYHSRGACTEIYPRRGALIVSLMYGTNQEWVREREIRAFKSGIYLGLAIGLIILALVLLLWAVPTVDGALQAVQR